MKNLKTLPVILCLFICKIAFAQEQDKSATIALFAGAINYQGDLNPNSFTFKNSNLASGIILRKPLNRWVTLRAGLNNGKIQAADSNNRDYLKIRNLSFSSSIKEAYLRFGNNSA